MSEFWIWFWRPIAELLGVLALLGVLGVLWLLVTLIFNRKKD